MEPSRFFEACAFRNLFTKRNPRSRVPIYHDNEKEVNEEREHGDQQHFIVEFHTIRPPSGYPEARQILER